MARKNSSNGTQCVYAWDGKEHKALAGFVAVEGEAPNVSGTLWLRKKDYPDGLPQTVKVTVEAA